ncbi:MAG: hypothetical protein K2X03_25020 [Bryobacteraceae bacterium]|nr:hypothetical protein [Bryobacteraceae bacterium]
MQRRAILALPALLAQEPDVDFICPMDRDVHAKNPGQCPRCGMRLVAGLPDPVEYRVELSTAPRRLGAGAPLTLQLRIAGQPKLQLIHERLFHLFIIGPGLEFFAHEHPVEQKDGSFTLGTRLPTPGAYRLLCDFFPEAGTPQMVAKTLIVPGPVPPVSPLLPSLTPRDTLSLVCEPAMPIAAQRTRLVFTLDPLAGFEPFLGAWGHLLIASQDRQDLIHTHPFLAYPERGHLQFNVIFPRPGVHRVWLQVQQAGVVRTVHFDVPVARLS